MTPGHATAPITQTTDPWATYSQACQALGARLAAYRNNAGLTRKQLASAMGSSVSTIRRAEIGANHFTADFWRTADDELNTGGVLATAWGHVAVHHRAAEAYSAEKAAVNDAASRCLSPADCLCQVVVTRWTQREIRALRVALRLGFPLWASVMQTDLETVYGWESPHGPLPSLQEQALFDAYLSRVDIDVRARFRKLLAATPPPATQQATSATASATPSGGQR
ncbi:helix-turn-helix transcriptional regulator [Hamadaea sp. NPDC050747]|uniref:helix-turn-helix domain-containing protein n=1 Tax=Hamadaea sp. NPDC050747 TaxID=3155789 RepID=UPI0033FD303A